MDTSPQELHKGDAAPDILPPIIVPTCEGEMMEYPVHLFRHATHVTDAAAILSLDKPRLRIEKHLYLSAVFKERPFDQLTVCTLSLTSLGLTSN